MLHIVQDLCVCVPFESCAAHHRPLVLRAGQLLLLFLFLLLLLLLCLAERHALGDGRRNLVAHAAATRVGLSRGQANASRSRLRRGQVVHVATACATVCTRRLRACGLPVPGQGEENHLMGCADKEAFVTKALA